MDGTLVDTAEQHFAAWQDIAREIGRPFSREDFVATFGRRNPEIIREVLDPSASATAIADIGEKKEAAYRAAIQRDGVRLLPGAQALIEALARQGWRQAIASSAPRANLDLILDLTGVRAAFAAIVSAEDTTRGKPDPEVFLIAANRLQAPPDRCVVFEDAVAGVAAARAAGMACVAVSSPGHHSEESLLAAGAQRVVRSLAELFADDVNALLVGGS